MKSSETTRGRWVWREEEKDLWVWKRSVNEEEVQQSERSARDQGGESPSSSPNTGTEEHGSKVSSQIPQGRLCFWKTDQLYFFFPNSGFSVVLGASSDQSGDLVLLFQLRPVPFLMWSWFYWKGALGYGSGDKTISHLPTYKTEWNMSNWCL